MSNKQTSLLKRTDQVIVSCIRFTSYLSGICLVGIMLVAFFNVIGEKLRSLGLPVTGIPASNEIVSYLHVPVVFIAMAYVTLDRGHTRIDMLTSKFPKWLEKALITVGYVMGIFVGTFISWRGFYQAARYFKTHKMSSVSGAGFPLWPFALLMAIGFAMLALSFIWAIVRQYAMKDEPVNETTGLKGGLI